MVRNEGRFLEHSGRREYLVGRPDGRLNNFGLTRYHLFFSVL